MTIQTPLHHVIQSLEGLGLEVTLCEKNENVPFDVALTTIGFDEQKRPLVLQIHQYDQNIVLASEEEAPSAPPDELLQMLTFLMTVPLEIPKETAPEILRLLALANKSFPLGALNYSEIEKSVYFSYGFPVFSTPPTDMTILLIINTILFAKETFFSAIEDVAQSRETVDTIIGESSLPAEKTEPLKL